MIDARERGESEVSDGPPVGLRGCHWVWTSASPDAIGGHLAQAWHSAEAENGMELQHLRYFATRRAGTPPWASDRQAAPRPLSTSADTLRTADHDRLSDRSVSDEA